ncbi:hypothetical protein K9M42_02845 [Patescibacteria group bacterium]|nr:hypothetical protein [Patescibacteria group bacterium]
MTKINDYLKRNKTITKYIRAKEIDDGGWVESDSMIYANGTAYIAGTKRGFFVDDDERAAYNLVEVDIDTIERGTEFFDKHNRRIYDGNIINVNGVECVVHYYQGMFRCYKERLFQKPVSDFDLAEAIIRDPELEIVGDIH